MLGKQQGEIDVDDPNERSIAKRKRHEQLHLNTYYTYYGSDAHSLVSIGEDEAYYQALYSHA